MNFRIGCAIWAYKGWVGDVFPVGSRSRDFLHLYSQQFTTVEGNTTFYSIPDAATVTRWAEETPAEFEFCLKLPKTLTHQGLLRPNLAATMQFLERMSGLGSRLGPLFAQLPPAYAPTQFADLEAYLTALPRIQPGTARSMEFAVEVRHPDWYREPYATRLNELLRSLGMGRVLLDSRPVYQVADDPQLHSERRKPRLPLQPQITAPFTLIRYISHPKASDNAPFLQEWVGLVDGWLRGGTRVYFFVHCPLEERSPANARQFQRLLEQNGTPIPPLMQTQTSPSAAQLSLFGDS